MEPELAFSVMILLPEALQREFERWTDQTEGTSWPVNGGHVTLLPPFQTALTPDAVVERVTAVCRAKDPFVLRLTMPMAVPDRTRQDYFAVFLAVAEGAETGRAEASALHDDLDRALASYKHDLLPEVSSRPFLPHVTLALGLSEREAGRVVRACAESSLAAEFSVDVVTVFAAPDAETTERPWQTAVRLGPEPEG